MNRKNINRKTVSFSRTEQVHVIKPCDLNGGGRLFGGALLGIDFVDMRETDVSEDVLSMLDEIAGIVAKRHSGCNNVTTAAIDHLDFKDGAYVNDLLVIIGYVTYTGNTSMEVRIDTYVENNEGMRHPINRAFFVMVAMGANNRPTKVPPLIIENEFQQAEWDCALKRKENRIKMKNDF